MSAAVVGKIEDIEKEIARTQVNKATMAHLCQLKAKLAKYKRELLAEPGKAGGGAGEGFDVRSVGDARVGFVGFPSVGKSTLLTSLTDVYSEVSSLRTIFLLPHIFSPKLRPTLVTLHFVRTLLCSHSTSVTLHFGYTPLVTLHFSHTPRWSHSTLVTLHVGHTPLWSHSTLVTLHFGHTPLWSHSTVSHTPLWSHSTLVTLHVRHTLSPICHTHWPSIVLLYSGSKPRTFSLPSVFPPHVTHTHL
jgi:hypothetical protein